MKPKSKKLKAIDPVYKIKKRKQIIDLGIHHANICIDSAFDSVDVRAYIKIEPYLILEFEFNTKIDYYLLFEAIMDNKAIAFDIHDARIDGPMNIVNMQGASGGTRVTLIPEKQSVEVGVLEHAIEIRFHLLNFANFKSKDAIIIKTRGGALKRRDAIVLEYNGYEIVIMATRETEQTMKLLKKRGGRAITHIGSIRKLDGSLLAHDDTNEILLMLNQFLSFAMGYWTSPILPVAYDANRSRVWESWCVRKISDCNGHQSWLDEHHPEKLIPIFQGFSRLWNDATWSETLKDVIYWYVFSNMRVANVDGSIIIAQAALERIAWTYLTEDTKKYSKTKAKKLIAYQRVTEVLNDWKIPITLPSNYTRLSAYAKELGCENGPHTIVKIRNNLVHPEDEAKDSGVIMDGQFYHEALSLSMWYIELMLLYLMEFSESYSNRINAKWVGEVEDVPWASPPP